MPHRSLAPADSTAIPGTYEVNHSSSSSGPPFAAAAPPVDVEGIEAALVDAENPLFSFQGSEVSRGVRMRDIEELLRGSAPGNRSRTAHMWLCALEGLTPEDVPYSVFGVSGFCYEVS